MAEEVPKLVESNEGVLKTSGRMTLMSHKELLERKEKGLRGDRCKFSHDATPETKSLPCCHFATQSCMKGDDRHYFHDLSKYPCNNFMTKGFCHRGHSCLSSHKGTPQAASDIPSVIVMTSSTNIAAASSNNKTVRQAIPQVPAIQARVSSSPPFLKPSSQSNKRKPSVAPKGMSFLSLDKTTQEEDTLKPSLGSKQKTQKSNKQSLKQSQQRISVPLVPPKGISFLSYGLEEPASSRNVKTTPNSHIKSSLNSAMKLAAELESA